MSNIQWTDDTSNPIHLVKQDGSHGGHWCKKVSAGCQNCYAEAQNNSGFFSFASHLNYSGEVPENLILDEEVCKKWLSWRKPKKIFVCSMTDLFGEWVKDEWIDKIFGYMAAASWHTFQVLTKRPERAIAYFNRPNLAQRIMDASDLVCKPELPLKNVHFGVTVENQAMADKRIPLLLQIPAAVRWLSVEPLLGEIELGLLGTVPKDINPTYTAVHEYISWVVVGGESGNGARPLPIEWVEAIRASLATAYANASQCQDAGVPLFVKQLGNFPVTLNPENFPKTESITRKDYASWCFEEAKKMGFELEGMCRIKLKDRKGGNIEEFPAHLQVREFPST